MKHTRILSLLVAILMLVAVFSGCSGSGEEATDAPTADATEAPAEATESGTEAPVEGTEEPAADGTISMPLSEEEITFTWFNTMNPNITTWLDDMNDILFYQEMEELTNVHIEWVTVMPDAANEQLNIMITAGDYTDISGNTIDGYPGGIQAAIDQDIIVVLNDYLPDYAPNYWALINSDESIYKTLSLSDGTICSFDVINDGPTNLDFGPMIRADWLEELGMESPVTYDDYYNFLTAVKTELGVEGGLLLPQQSAVSGNYLSAGFGVAAFLNTVPALTAPFYQENGVVKFGPLEDGYRQYVETMAQWYAEGLINADYVSLGNGWDPDETTIANGEAAIWYSDRGNLTKYVGLIEASDPDVVVTGIQDARQNADDQLHFGDFGYLASNNNGLYILTACEEIEIACQLFDYRYTEEGAMLGNYGVEGITYTLDEDGTPVYTDLITGVAEYGPETALQLYCLWRAPMLTMQSKLDAIYDESIIAASEAWETGNDNSNVLPSAVTLDSDANAEFTSIFTDMTTYITESLPKFITGEFSMDEFDGFVEQLYSMNIERCIELYQAALDAYNAK